MSNNFCRYLTNGLRVQSWTGTLVASPCCYLPQTPIYDADFEQKMSRYHSLPVCYNCMYYVSNNTEDPSYPPNRAKRIINDVDHTDPVYAELSLDNKCNAACMSCTDLFSSLWIEQNKKFNIKTEDDYPDPQNDDQVADDLFNKFNFSHLTDLNFLGGEPLISRANLLVLERLVEKDIAKNVQVLFTTNGSTRPTDRQIDLLKEFKRVTFSYSIDGIGDRFHYLRYPLKWDKLLSVIESVRSITQITNLKIVVNSTVSSLSAFYIGEIDQWVDQHFKNDPRFVNFHTPPCTDIMSLAAMPYSAKKYLADKYAGNSRLEGLFKSQQQDDDHAIKKFLEHLTFWDKCRNLNWQEVFPEAVPFYSDYLNKQ